MDASRAIVICSRAAPAIPPSPTRYQGKYSPYYTASHVAFRAKVRAFVEKELKPHMDDWLAAGEAARSQSEYRGYPLELHRKAYEAGIAGVIYPREHGGTPPPGFDAFHELILWDELARIGGGGVLGQLGINSMALPPVITAGTDAQKALVCRDVISGRKNISLAISEPGAGSDVANIQATAVLDPTGEFYVVNGAKKWITGGLFADFFTTAVRTGGPDSGMGGISLLLIERDRPGIKVRKMKTQFSTTHNTTFILFNDVKVPRANLIGQEGMGFFYIVNNFNHERFVSNMRSTHAHTRARTHAPPVGFVRGFRGLNRHKTMPRNQLYAGYIECWSRYCGAVGAPDRPNAIGSRMRYHGDFTCETIFLFLYITQRAARARSSFVVCCCCC